jgi:2-dehydro-3-deoxyphosphogluconate aldolase/(4S)-4-hydroxy-2-oxoglutarate aldolase
VDALYGIFQNIGDTAVISIVRKIPIENILDTVEALYLGGIRCVEITMDSPKGLDMVERVRDNYQDKMLIGAGTVLDSETARCAILSGADFILSPTLCTKVIEMCNTYGKLAVPGVFTPTEALTAVRAGAQLVKIFPVSSVGPSYIKDIMGPLEQVKMLAVGGVNADNAAEYIKCGAYALGVGSCLVNKQDVLDSKFDMITSRAATIINNVKNIKCERSNKV